MASGERFVQIPIEFLRDETLSAEAKLVGLVFASYANQEGVAWPGLKLLMRCTGMGRDRVKRGRAELVGKNFLKTEQPKGRESPGGRFGRVRYRLSPKLLVNRRTEIQSSDEERNRIGSDNHRRTGIQSRGEKGDQRQAGAHRRTGRPEDGFSGRRNFRLPVFQSTEQ